MDPSDEQPQIGISPLPPHQGDSMTVTYPGTLPAEVVVDFDPGDPFTVVITSKSGTSVKVPGNATSVVVTDPTGQVGGNGSMVAP